MNVYTDFVTRFVDNLEYARGLQHGGFAPLPRPATATGKGCVMVLSPHPDDECIVAPLALRLMRESTMKVVNVAVTQGSNKARQAGRLEELRGACRYLGFDVVTTVPDGLESINPKGREQKPDNWGMAVDRIAEIIAEHRPAVILFPHDRDANTTHVGVFHLALEALARQSPDYRCIVGLTEFWAPMEKPNLMVETDPAMVADLIAALTFHVGEITRNPYHLTLPSWMSDNVRRGGELVGSQGGAPPDYSFAVLYGIRRWQDGRLVDGLDAGVCVPADQPLAATLGLD